MLTEAGGDPDANARQAAERALRLLPTRDDQGVPELLEGILGATGAAQLDPLGYRLQLKATTGTLLALVRSGEWPVRYAALAALLIRDPDPTGESKRARVELLNTLARDPRSEVRRKASFALRRLTRPTPADLPRLRRDLRVAAAKTRTSAWRDLALLGPQAVPALEDVVSAMRSGSQREVMAGIGVLGAMGSPAIPALFGLLADSDSRVSRAALDRLRRMGRPAAEHVRTLGKHSEVRVRRAAVRLLRALSAVEDYAAWLDDPDAVVRRSAVEALAGWRGVRSVSGLIVALDSDDLVVVRTAARALGRRGGRGGLGTREAEIASALAKLLAHDDDIVARAAGTSLGALGEVARPHLDPALASEDERVRVAALQGMRAWGDGAGERIVALYDHPSASIRLAVIEAAARVASAAPTVLAALDDPDSKVQLAALRALRGFPKAKQRAIPRLFGLLKNVPVRAHALSLLLQIGLPAVEEGLRVAETKRSPGLAWYFGQLPARYAAWLMGRLDDERPWKRRETAIWALGRMARSARAARPALEKLVDHPTLGPAAKEALERIGR